MACGVCMHPNRQEIDAELISGIHPGVVGDKHRVFPHIWAHYQGCLGLGAASEPRLPAPSVPAPGGEVRPRARVPAAPRTYTPAEVRALRERSRLEQQAVADVHRAAQQRRTDELLAHTHAGRGVLREHERERPHDIAASTRRLIELTQLGRGLLRGR